MGNLFLFLGTKLDDWVKSRTPPPPREGTKGRRIINGLK
jgi:hypothetical protein